MEHKTDTDSAAFACCNTWFESLPEGRKAVLRDDKWMLAHAAFQAGRASLAASAGSERTMDEAFDCARAALLQCPDRASVRAVLDTLRARVEKAMGATSAGSEPVAWRAHFDAWWARNRVSTHQVKNIGGFSAKVWHAAIQTVVGATDSTAGFYPADEGSTPSRQATHPSPPEGAGWRPISEAPKDRTVIDIWRPSFGGERCPDMLRVDLGNGNVFYEPLLAGLTCVRDATHFMIVAPPASEAKERGNG